MNEYIRIKEYMCNEPRLKPFLEQAEKECLESNCQSWVVILTLTIEKLLDAYKDKCDDLKIVDEQIRNYLKRSCNL